MRSILLSIKPKYVELIASGKKTVEVRKTRPKLETPFKCYIYCAIGNGMAGDYLVPSGIQCGKVIGEFVCDKVDCFFANYCDNGSADLTPSCLIYGLGNANSELAYLDKCCLTHDELFNYIIYGKYGFGWHITDLKIYDKARELGEFLTLKKCNSCKSGYESTACVYDEDCKVPVQIKRPPQSYMYVEELGDNEND